MQAPEFSHPSESASTLGSDSDVRRHASWMLGAAVVGVAAQSARSAPSRPQWDAVAIERDLRQVAALPGEPRFVSAAAVTLADDPLLTIENASAFADSRMRRLVIVGDDRSSRAVL